MNTTHIDQFRAAIEAEIVTFERPKCVSISTARAPAPRAVEGTV